MLTVRMVEEESGALLSSLRWNASDYEAVSILAESLQAIGQMMPVRIDQYGTVLAGNKRCEAAYRLHWPRIVVEIVER